ncbi:MAG: Rpn family recombination-promoting nuclease/putative transposase [Muribaculaceae bacterium]|nr:Rpn family recombination-promoting nuclease/putative transposase [Muribaculaceae bacterium]
MAHFINPFVDFGFKYIFGREESKIFLIDFLNQLLRNEPNFSEIVDLEYLDKEQSRSDRHERGIIYDIHCRTSNGKRFIVEMQNQGQPYFFDRIIYYSSRGVVEQGRVGADWEFDYLPVYCVSFMNFVLKGYEDQFRIDVGLCNLKTGQLFTDKQRYIFIQTPLFDKKNPEDCKTGFDKWMYNIINMPTMDTIAFTEEKYLFDKLAKVTSYASLSREEKRAYDADLKAYRDIRGQLKYSRMEGIEEGRKEGRVEGRKEGRQEGRQEEKISLAKALAEKGMSAEFIADVVKLTVDNVRQIIDNKK